MNTEEMIVQQARNVLNSMKDLKRLAHKKGKERSDLFERFFANKHSFQIYSNIDSAIKQLDEVQLFLQKLQSFSSAFEPARYDFEGEVDEALVESTYPEVLEAYNNMVTKLGFEKEIINVKRF